MKKKKFALAAVIIALTGAIAVGSAGCDWLVKKPDANFPYDGAVAEGFTGTEAEWLGSGYDAGTREYALYKEAVQEGYRGTYLPQSTARSLPSLRSRIPTVPRAGRKRPSPARA